MDTCIVILVLCTISLGLVGTSVACNGYQLKVNHIRNCNPNSIIKLQRLSVTLDKDCNIIPSGCVTSTKKFQTAQAHYILNKPPLPALEGDVDLCETLSKNKEDSANQILDMFQLPKQCPVNAGKVCGDVNKKINISKYKNRLAMVAGNINFKADITHNNGVSCIDASLTLEKPRPGK